MEADAATAAPGPDDAVASASVTSSSVASGSVASGGVISSGVISSGVISSDPRRMTGGKLTTVSAWAENGVRPVAAFMLATVVFARAIAPSIRGIAVGYDAFTNRAAYLADGATIALVLALVTMGLIQSVALIGSRAPLSLRVPGMLLGSLALLTAIAAPSVPRPPFPLLVASSVTSSALAILIGGSVVRQRSTAPFGIVAILSAIATLTRLVAVYVADSAVAKPKSDAPELARILATGSFGLEAAIVVVAAAWLAFRSRRIALPLMVVALVASFLATRSVIVDTSNTHAFSIILRIGARGLLTRPVPYVPYYAEVFLVLVATLVATVALVVRTELGTWVGALAILLVVRGAAEIPVYAAGVAVACGGMLLAAHDPRSLFQALLSRDAARSRAVSP